ncbi:MAG: putative glycoside hydrolase [Candidatus Actinomarina sp.]
MLVLVTGFLLVLLYPDDIIYEENINSFKENNISITNTTSYKPKEDAYLQNIKKLIKNSDLSTFDTLIRDSNKVLLKDFDEQLESIRKANLDNFAFIRFDKFKEEYGQLRGLYLNGYLFNNDEKRNLISEILTKTNVNTLVVDVKTDNGHILFDADIEEIELLKNERIKFSAEDLTELRSVKDIYLIARIVVYQDPLFAKIFPDEAVYDSRLDKPYSQDGQYFLDPSSIKVQNYIKNIALQACELGFDEIQYDYIRYPDSNSKFHDF